MIHMGTCITTNERRPDASGDDDDGDDDDGNDDNDDDGQTSRDL